MSDAKVGESLDRIEAWLADPNSPSESLDLAEWNEAYANAVAQAERGTGWPALVARAHALGEQLNARMELVIRERDEIKIELDSFARGSRALKGYGTSTR